MQMRTTSEVVDMMVEVVVAAYSLHCDCPRVVGVMVEVAEVGILFHCECLELVPALLLKVEVAEVAEISLVGFLLHFAWTQLMFALTFVLERLPTATETNPMREKQ